MPASTGDQQRGRLKVRPNVEICIASERKDLQSACMRSMGINNKRTNFEGVPTELHLDSGAVSNALFLPELLLSIARLTDARKEVI